LSALFVAVAETTDDLRALGRSVERPVPRSHVLGQFSRASHDELQRTSDRAGGFFVWGVRPRSDSVLAWMQMQQGDHVLISSINQYCQIATVLARYQNERAAQAIWPVSPDEDAREFLFFLTEPLAIAIPRSELAEFIPVTGGELVRVDDQQIRHIADHFGSVEQFLRKRILKRPGKAPALDVSRLMRVAEDIASESGAFRAHSVTEGRRLELEAIIRRRGQTSLRKRLLKAYKGRCAVTGCAVETVLEAAHISPYLGDRTHDLSNALLLRSDVHTLFDLGKLGVDGSNFSVVLAEELVHTNYRVLAGRKIQLPERIEDRPSRDALESHRTTWGL
jgi:hypothetical protein